MNNNPQNPTNSANPQNQQFQRPQYIGATPQIPSSPNNPMYANQTRQRATTVSQPPGITHGAQIGAQIRPIGPGASQQQRSPTLQNTRSAPGMPNTMGNQPGNAIKPPTMNGFQTQANISASGSFGQRTTRIPGVPMTSQPNPSQINQQPAQSFQPQNPLIQPPNPLIQPQNPLSQPQNPLSQPQNPLSQPPNPLSQPPNPLSQPSNPLSQPQRIIPQNIPGLQQKRPVQTNSPASQIQPQPLQSMGFSNTLQQNLRTSQDPPLLRTNSPSFSNTNLPNQQNQIPQPQQINQLQQSNQPQQTQIFIKPIQKQPQQPQQQPQQPQQQATSFQQMQLELKRKQQEELLKQQQQIQQDKINQQQKRILLQQKQEEKERNEEQQKLFEEKQQIQQQQILNKIAQANNNFPFEQQQNQNLQSQNSETDSLSTTPQIQLPPTNTQSQKQENIPNSSVAQIQPQLISNTFLSQQQPISPQPLKPIQIEPLVPPQQPLQVEPLAPLQLQPLQVEPISPIQPQPLQVEPLVPPQNQSPIQIQPLVPPQQPLQVEPLVPPQNQSPIQIQPLVPPQQPLQVEPLAPLQPQPLQVEPLAPLQPQPLQVEPLAPLQLQPLQVEPISPIQPQPLQVEPLVPPQNQSPIQIQPLVPPQQPLQVEPLVPPQNQSPIQIQPLAPPTQQPLQVEPISPIQPQPLQVEPLVPPQNQSPIQIQPLVPPTQQPPIQIQPLVPPTQQPLQVEPLVPPQNQSPIQIQPLVPPTQQPLQIEPLVPPQNQSPIQIQPLVPPTQQPLQIEPLVPPQNQSPIQIQPLTPPTQQSPIQIQPLVPPLQTDPTNSHQLPSLEIEPNAQPPLNNEETKQAFPSMPSLEINGPGTHSSVSFGLDQGTGTLDFNEELSGDEDDTPASAPPQQPQSVLKVRRSLTVGAEHGSTQKTTFDTSKLPRFLGRRETIMMQQGTRKRRNSSFRSCLVPEINEEDMKTVNTQIQGILDDQDSGMNKFSWSAKYVVNCVQEENPYIDPKAISLSMQAAGGNNNVVKLFSEKVRPIHFQKIDDKPPVVPTNDDSKNVPMVSDITDKSKPPSINQLSDHEIPNAADYFFKITKPPTQLFTIEDMPIVGLSKRKFASIRVRDIKTEFEIIEPLFFGAFIIQDGTIISEQWTFTNKGSGQFIQDLPNISKASFQLPTSFENTYFCVVVSRFILPENGATVNKYYQKPNAKSLLAAKNQAHNYNKFIGVYAPFALTFIDLKTLLENKYIDLPPPFTFTGPLKGILKQIKPGAQRMGDFTYPIYIILDANILEASHIQDILVENTLFVRLASPLPLTPCYSFRHRLLVRMNQVNLHTQARNIYAELKVKSELGELPIFSTAYSNSKSKTIFTRCWYHDKKPFFDELFVIDLPLPLPKSLSLTITFFNASLKNVGQKGTDPKDMIGVCTIPLLEGNNKFLSDGEHYYPVEYKGQPSISSPAFNMTTLLDSSLISTDSNLNKFYENVDSKVLEKCNDREVTINMFSIIDQIVNHFMNNGSECMKSLAILTKKKVSLDWNIIENCLNDYAIYFAFRNENACTPQFHRSLLSSWAEFMKTNPDSNRTDSRLIPFFFNMIIKSLYLTKDQDFSKEFSAFIIQWSKLLDPQQIGEYARFLNLLFDIGCYYYAVIAIECQMANLLNITSKHQILIEFLSQVLRPKLFYSALVYVDRLKLNILDMIKYSKRPDCTALQFIFKPFLRLFAQYSPEMKQRIAERLINSLEILSPFESIHFIGGDGNHPVVYYYCFILSCVSYEAFSNWLSHQVDHFTDFFKTLHFMIANIKDKELIRVSYFAILHIISFIEQMKDLEGVIEATNIIYHFLCVDLPLDFVSPLIKTFSSLIEENYEILLVYSNPALPRHLVKLLNLSYLVPDEVADLLKILYETDMKIYGNTLRSHSVICRAVYSLKSLDVIKLPPNLQLPITPIINNLIRILHLTSKNQLSEEKYTELIYEKAKMMFPSPDSTIECLNELIEYHRKHEYSAEEIQVLILQASIIIEFLVCQNKIDFNYLHITTPSKYFSDLCPLCESFKCPEGGDFIVKGYCDSAMFSERSLVNHLIFIIERSMETKYLEIGYLLIDKIWPILEHRRIYTLLTNTFTRFGDCYKALAEIPPDEDRLFGHYFRICFYGNVFREENGKIYIYREKKLTHLFELTNRLVDYYTEICKPTKIELIKESGSVDATKLDQSKGYIQITFVEPYHSKAQNYTRVTSFERSHVLDSFFFDTPFTRGGNKAQASIDQQWVRRTVLHVETQMPSIVKRIKVTLSEVIEFAPIRVAYRQIRDRISLLKNAIERSDYRAIQQLLHGSLLVQVNEGPSKMAEVFLGEAQPSPENTIENFTKYREKMKAAFKEFLTVNQKGIDIHSKYAEDNPVFIPLQHELESGFTALQETISKYV